MEWATLPLKRYAEFTGRSRRKEYWMFFLLCLVVALVIGFVEGLLGLNGMIGPYGPISTLFLLAILIPSIAVGIRRLHDTDRSGWWIFISLIPLIGSIVLLVFEVLPGTPGSNRFGPDPKAATGEARVV